MRPGLFFCIPYVYAGLLLKIILLVVISSFTFIGCSPSSLSIVPDESNYLIQSKESTNSAIEAFRARANELRHGSAVYSATLKTPLYSRTFEQGIVFSERRFRASLYAANFARLLFYVVVNGKTSLTCDVDSREAIYSYNGVMCLPDLPPQLADPQLLLDILLGRFAWETENSVSLNIYLSSHFTNEKKMLLRFKNQGEEIDGLFLNQLKDIRFDNFIFPERIILRPLASMTQERTYCEAEADPVDEILIEYDYADNARVRQPILPSMIRVQIPSRDITLEYQTIRFSNEIEGSADQLFDTSAPPSYRVLKID